MAFKTECNMQISCVNTILEKEIKIKQNKKTSDGDTDNVKFQNHSKCSSSIKEDLQNVNLPQCLL